MNQIRVLVADDHPAVRLGIRTLLTGLPDLEVVGEAGDGYETLRLVKETRPDVLLLDMALPGINGINVAQQLKRNGSRVAILAFSGYSETRYVQGVLSGGALGYLTKDEAPEMLVQAIRGVAQGKGGWYSRQVLYDLTINAHSKKNERLGLTRREIEILRVVASGKTNCEIANLLGISEKTVERHLQIAFNKLGVVSRVEAAVRLIRAGLA
jgi:DNA-binding NarL/FixJ family response regulator